MKKLIFVVFITCAISLPIFALTPPYFGLLTQAQGVSYTTGVGKSMKTATDFAIFNGMELMLGNEFFFYLKSGLLIHSDENVYPTNSLPLVINTGIGMGYRLIDTRYGDSRGHSLVLTGTFSMMVLLDMSYDNFYKAPTIPGSTINDKNFFKREVSSGSYGGELCLTYYYNVFKHFALRVGANFGVYGTSITDKYINTNTVITTTPRGYTNESSGVSLTYGLSVGLAF